MIKIQPDRFRIELDGIIEILQEWQERLAKGIPGDELPASDLNIEKFEIALKAELQLVAGKIFGLSETVD
jgi:hypothetical protein